MKSMGFFKNLICLAALALCASCVSVMESAGRWLDGSSAAEKKIAQYYGENIEITVVRNKAGEESVLIAIDNFPMMKLRGPYPGDSGEFYLSSLEYLAGSVHGWNEYTLDLSAEGSLLLGETAVLGAVEEIEPVQISAGRIQRYDTRITGNEALTSLRNRRERIAAVGEWMSSIENAPRGQTITAFEKYWKPVFFPELVQEKKRPEGWRQEGDEFARADDIRWNTSYTERVFSQELWPVRNSGTLLRDWEEALSWIYMEYEWASVKETLSREIILQKK